MLLLRATSVIPMANTPGSQKTAQERLSNTKACFIPYGNGNLMAAGNMFGIDERYAALPTASICKELVCKFELLLTGDTCSNAYPLLN